MIKTRLGIVKTKTMARLIEADSRIIDISSEGEDGFFIYTRSADFHDGNGSGTFHGDNETQAAARFKANVVAAAKPAFFFCLTVNAPGYLPDAIDYHSADCAVDAFDTLCAAVREFKEDMAERYDGFTAHDWKAAIEKGFAAKSFAGLQFVLAEAGGGLLVLDFIGMTETEFNAQQ